MSYSARITTFSKQAIVFLVDQSGSMSEPISWHDGRSTKSAAVADVLNSTIGEIVARCNNYGEYKPYFDIAVLGYSGAGVRSLISEDKAFVSPAELAFSWIRKDETSSVRVLPNGKTIATCSNKKIWVESKADGCTPMVGAFRRAYEILSGWIGARDSQQCIPPMVINITDGQATDGNHDKLVEVSLLLRSLATEEGGVVVMNVHISNLTTQSSVFPSVDNCPETGENDTRTLFEMSSDMPEFFEREIAEISNVDNSPYKAFAYNASIADLVRMINIGSSTTSLII